MDEIYNFTKTIDDQMNSYLILQKINMYYHRTKFPYNLSDNNNISKLFELNNTNKKKIFAKNIREKRKDMKDGGNITNQIMVFLI
jgi:hypothetical protein